jgi:hypothetical protein
VYELPHCFAFTDKINRFRQNLTFAQSLGFAQRFSFFSSCSVSLFSDDSQFCAGFTDHFAQTGQSLVQELEPSAARAGAQDIMTSQAFLRTLFVGPAMFGSIIMAQEPSNNQTAGESAIVQAQAQSSPSPSSRSPVGNILNLPELNSPSAGPNAPAVRRSIGDADLSQQLNPSRPPRSRYQFASTNRSTTTFRPANIFGDTMGSQNRSATLVIPVVYENVSGVNLGGGNFGFDVAGSSALDVFGIVGNNSSSSLTVIEPLNPTGAFIPSEDGIQQFRFGGGTATPLNNSNFDVTYFYQSSFESGLPSSTTALIGRQKIAENVSPIPQNRLFVNYSYFDRTPLGGGIDVRRWTPGFESLVLSEKTSFEMRLPMAMTLSSNNFADSEGVQSHEVGNVYMAIKQMIYRSEDSAISIGTSMTVPTGDDLNIFVRSRTFGQRQILKIENETVHVLPFVGWYKGNNRFFTQGFFQIDIDTNGNTVLFNPDFRTEQLEEAGRLQDATFSYFDVQTGVWLKRLSSDEVAGRSGNGFTGIAAVSELHWNRSLQAEDNILFPSGVSFVSPRSNVQVLNALVGLNFEHNFRTNLGIGYATPIGNGSDHEFKGEWRVIFNRYF